MALFLTLLLGAHVNNWKCNEKSRDNSVWEKLYNLCFFYLILFQLPVDLTLLSDSARNGRLERRKLKTKVKLDEEFEEEGFDAKKYLKFVKN